MRPLRPRRLREGDLVAIAAPSGPAPPARRAELDAAVHTIERMGFEVKVTDLVEAGSSHFWRAGTPAAQAAELNDLFAAPEVRAIVPFAGGNATTGYLDLLDYEAVLADPKPMLGYSDITALHLALYSRTGLIGMHADFAARGFGDTWPAAGRGRREQLERLYKDLLTGGADQVALPPQSEWETWKPGRATGRLVGGLLDRMVRLQSTPYGIAPDRFEGTVLFWEEVGRKLGHVWNDLHALRLQGILDRIGAMVVGIPSHIESPRTGFGDPTVKDVVLDVMEGIDAPVLANVDFGHTGPNLPMPIGVLASVDADARELRLLESPVA